MRSDLPDTAQTGRSPKRRAPLSRERVLRRRSRSPTSAASSELTMRKLAKELGVEAMSLYNHVANKDDLLDGMIDIVFSEIDPPAADGDWKAELRKRALSTRAALRRHRWAVGEMEGRTTHGPLEPPHPRRGARLPARRRLLGRDDRPRVLGPGRLHLRLRAAGDRHVARDAGGLRGRGAAADGRVRGRCSPTSRISSRSSAATSRRSGYDYEGEFLFGLDVILDGLERLLAT